jgi:hypothetical protein
MQSNSISIGFAPNLVPLIQKGTKTLTYRIGNKYAFLSVGDTIPVRNSSTNEIFADVEITEKSYTTFADLPIDRLGHEVYSSKEEQKETFEKYYEAVNDKDKILVLGFKVLKFS